MPLPSATGWFGVVLDCADARELCAFYEQLLGWQPFRQSDEWCDLAPSETAGHNLAFATNPDYVPPVWPPAAGEQQMMLHLDLGVRDLDAAVSYAVDAGATLADHQPQDDVRVLLDPAGHPFCLYVDE